ncbi:hypothetical protein SteCoe_17588 [Stentor coeruleus]|uniref:Uncharacterized protein n=1 Tax=Stentor coeruleus TaxID=5963 RepID=A0A1R2BZ13_9CILI|nr:hypothetical protein SteCoe_17588 [Stentor coeruleus]
MLEQLSKNPEIQSFLEFFPKHQWRKCIEAGLVQGIRKIRENNHKPVYQDITIILGESQDDTIRTALQNMRKEIEELSGKVEIIESRPRIDFDLKIPKIITNNIDFIKPNKRESPIQSSSKSKIMSIPRQNSYESIAKSQDKIIPKNIKNVQSKIKENVHKNPVSFSHKIDSRSYSVIEIDNRINSSRELKEPNVMPLEKIKQLDLNSGLRKNIDKGYDRDEKRFMSRQGKYDEEYFGDEKKFGMSKQGIKDEEYYEDEKRYKMSERGKQDDNEMFKIADDFLSNPFTSYLIGGYKYK